MMSESQPGAHPHDLEHMLHAEIIAAESPDQPVRKAFRHMRSWVSSHPRLDRGYRVFVGIVGGSMAVLGLLLVPLPGPGWLVVFLGLAVLGTEFRWARRVAAWLKRMLDRFWAWLKARRAGKATAAETMKGAA